MLAVCIILGKPSHNGFQERVFSQGTYRDDKLRKRVRDENFEMRVLDNLNAAKCEELLQDINLQGQNDDDPKYVRNFISARSAAAVGAPPLRQPSQEEEMIWSLQWMRNLLIAVAMMMMMIMPLLIMRT
jgi:hypothetical protein